MEALSVDDIPTGEEWQYEPKWDGFRCLVFRDGDKVELQSKSGQSLTRYFPELVEAVRSIKAAAFVLDGEIVVPVDRPFSFDAAAATHPSGAEPRAEARGGDAGAPHRVRSPGGADGKPLIERPLRERRPELEAFAHKWLRGAGRIRMSPATTKLAEAKSWLKRVGATLDGIMAKRRDLEYRSGDRTGMQKIKNYRSADCVVGGFRYNEGKPVSARSCSAFMTMKASSPRRLHLGDQARGQARTHQEARTVDRAAGIHRQCPGRAEPLVDQRSSEWQPLKPKLVVEVCYDHFAGERFRHGTKLMRWRPDKSPKQCTMEQVKQKKADLLKLLK
jgi:ATP-dependent DNA ligase